MTQAVPPVRLGIFLMAWNLKDIADNLWKTADTAFDTVAAKLQGTATPNEKAGKQDQRNMQYAREQELASIALKEKLREKRMEMSEMCQKVGQNNRPLGQLQADGARHRHGWPQYTGARSQYRHARGNHPRIINFHLTGGL